MDICQLETVCSAISFRPVIHPGAVDKFPIATHWPLEHVTIILKYNLETPYTE